MECIFCTTEIAERAKFCSACKKQVKCLSCSAILEIDAEICIECGEALKKTMNQSQNVIEFSETKNTRNFKASFSDEVGIQISDSLGLIIGGRLSSAKGQEYTPLGRKSIGADSTKDSQNEEQEPEDIDHEDIKDANQITGSVNSIFKEKDGAFSLEEPRLKATNRIDYARRLTVLFISFNMQNGTEKVPKKSLNKFMTDASLNDGNWRRWLNSNNLIQMTDETVTLNIPGKEHAKAYLNDVFDANKTDEWVIGTAPRTRKKKNNTQNDNN